jgi:aminopeptidase N
MVQKKQTGLYIGVMLLLSTMGFTLQAQLLQNAKRFTRADTLRGSLNAERNWWEVQHYDITVMPDFLSKSIRGEVTITFSARPGVPPPMQIDLQAPMVLDKAVLLAPDASSADKPITRITQDGNVWRLHFGDHRFPLTDSPSRERITLYFHGTPREAVRPPWDGGWIWRKDANGNPWMSVACQGLGASVWYPCKDHQSDKPDLGAALNIIVPDSLTGVGNGRLKSKTPMGDGTTRYRWEVKNSINTYCIIPYIGKYVNFGESYFGENGPLSLNYWVLDYNIDKAKTHFTDVPRMLKAFEYWFGPYPFYSDGYQLVDAPHLGMEHQSAIAYGNAYRKGYLGQDLSGSGWGTKWDFIIVHESGHEWFANNITTSDIADMWVHEGFTNYSETLFTDYHYGKEAGNDYVIGTRSNIQNDIPIIGPYGVNKEGSGDMYYKAGNMLHTIRQLVGNDGIFRQMLHTLNRDYHHKTVTTQEIEAFISKYTKLDLSKVFDQYLRTTQIPKLLYRITGNTLHYQWVNCIPGFNMPVKILTGDSIPKMIYPVANKMKTEKLPANRKGKYNCTVDRNFFVDTRQL